MSIATYHPEAYNNHGFENRGDFPTGETLRLIAEEATQFGLVSAGENVFQIPDVPWTFTRCWVYWSARTNGNGLPQAKAVALWELKGGEIRADGHCGSPRPERAVRSYHVDTPAGLRLLIETLRSA